MKTQCFGKACSSEAWLRCLSIHNMPFPFKQFPWIFILFLDPKFREWTHIFSFISVSFFMLAKFMWMPQKWQRKRHHFQILTRKRNYIFLLFLLDVLVCCITIISLALYCMCSKWGLKFIKYFSFALAINLSSHLLVCMPQSNEDYPLINAIVGFNHNIVS